MSRCGFAVFHAALLMIAYAPRSASGSVVLENSSMRLVIRDDGTAESLVHLPSRQECLIQGIRVPVFMLGQDRPYNNELQLAYPAKKKVFRAKSVRREGDRLVVTFELVDHVVTIRTRITDRYIGFTVDRVRGETPLDEITFLQLPVRARTYFGEWLNVVWDAQVAINVLATDPAARINSEEREGYYLLQASAIREVKMEGTGAALITAGSRSLLDAIRQAESDFNLPHGAESRRREEQRWSYYWTADVTPQNVREHIAYARQAGFREMVVHYSAFAKTAGHFPWRPEYPNGIADLKAVVRAIKKAELLPGLHIHYNKADKEDAYVTPVPDDRLNRVRTFTLAERVDAGAGALTVLENPQGCTLDDERRVLKMGKELITYAGYTTVPPYRFTGCNRGQLGSRPAAHEAGMIFGLLDVDTWPKFIRFSQNTDIQEETARRIANFYREGGFQFVYFDGAEDVPPPYWFTVSKAQWEVYRLLDPEPLFAEGACKSHFSWHMLNRGNAFDAFRPETIKAMTRRHPAAEAVRMAQDFTRLNFGWVGYWVPDRTTVGTQPDMIEYVTSRAAAWDSPISLLFNLEQLKTHPRTPDNLEVIRRWEEVRYRHWLTDDQKQQLRNVDQEHILLINEKKEFELVPCEQIQDVARGTRVIRAFVFDRAGKTYVVFWHTSGSANLEVPMQGGGVRLLPELGGAEIPVKKTAAGIVLPAAGRQYLDCGSISRDQVVKAFQAAQITSR